MHTIIHLDSIDSTNSFAKREIAMFLDGAPTFIIAQEQTAGRGRFGNSWVSPKEQNLYLTLVERVRPPLQLVNYSLAASLAVRAVLKEFGISAAIKWPNDLLVEKKKICGILVEGTSRKEASWAIVGIGLNVNMEESLLKSIDRPATSMREVLSTKVSLKDVTEKICEILLSALENACLDPDLCRRQYLEGCSWMKGSPVTVQTSTGTIEGIIEEFSQEGHLIIKDKNGKTVSIAQGVIL